MTKQGHNHDQLDVLFKVSYVSYTRVGFVPRHVDSFSNTPKESLVSKTPLTHHRIDTRPNRRICTFSNSPLSC